MMAGFGFDGYDEKGKEKWDLLSNANIYQIEVGSKLFLMHHLQQFMLLHVT